jgi:hypothetical protein
MSGIVCSGRHSTHRSRSAAFSFFCCDGMTLPP